MCGVPAATQAMRVAVSAAIPEAKATASSVPSNCAKARSNRSTLGFQSR